MSINHAILGILSWKPLTGYDLKKIIQDSTFMYWSGNNNQIYKSLLELLDDGFVTNETYHQENAPSKKVYTITQEGLGELKNWVLTSSEPPELKKQFLVQLAWADMLLPNELNTLFSDYENQIRMQILIQQEKYRRGTFSPARTKREIYLWDMIHDNIISTYKNELTWLEKIRKEIGNVQKEETNKMNYSVIQKNNRKYINLIKTEAPICLEEEVLDLVGICFENDTNLVLLHGGVLSDDFYNLKTGIAGMIMQKFINYQIHTAVLLPEEFKITGRFKELLTETKKGNDFRVFNDISEAETWLIN